MSRSEDSRTHRSAGFLRGLAAILFSIALGVSVSLLTKNAFAGAAIPFILAAWRSFRSGVFVYQHDDNSTRARICFLFQLATAFWLGAVSALMTVLTFVVAFRLTGQKPDMNHFAVVMSTFVVGIAANMTLGGLAILDAIRNQIKVWVQPDLPGLFADQVRITSSQSVNGFNYAIIVIATTAFLPAGILIFVAGIFAGQPPFDFFDLFLLPALILIVAPMIVLLGYGWLSKQIIAVCPAECWPQEKGS